MNMRFWFEALADPNRIAAQVLTTSPMNVRTLGLIRESASQRTMVSRRTPQARPKAEVQETLISELPGRFDGVRFATCYLTRRNTGESSALKLPARSQVPSKSGCIRDPNHENQLCLRLFGRLAFDVVVDRTQLQDFQSPLAVRGNDDCFIPDLLVQQGPPDGAGSRNLSRRDVRLLAGDQLVFNLFFLGAVVHLDGRTKAHFVVRDIVHVDHRQVGQPLAKLANARLHELLALLGHVILGILAEVAKRGGLLDLFRKFMDQLVFKRVDLFLQFFLNKLCHGFTKAGLRQDFRYYTPCLSVPAPGRRSKSSGFSPCPTPK